VHVHAGVGQIVESLLVLVPVPVHRARYRSRTRPTSGMGRLVRVQRVGGKLRHRSGRCREGGRVRRRVR
jgi:hypothetical protein